MASGGFDKRERNGVVWYAVSFLEKTALARAAFTTRLGGVSRGGTATMNLSFARADPKETVRENYRLFCGASGFPEDALAVSRQVHGTYVHEVLDGDVGTGVFDDAESVQADALMTARRGVVLVKHSADCVPVYLLDARTPAAALVHAGWRGTLEGIAAEALRRMAEAYGTRPQDCLAAVGPSIGPCCFEVGPDVAERFAGRFPGREIVVSGDRPHVDLWRCNVIQLLDAGIPEHNVSVSGLCTACNTGIFYSHRREKGGTGAMAAMLELL